MLVQEFLERSASRLPDKVALVVDGRRLTYAEIESDSNRFANALIAMGVQRGDRVVLFLPNCLELVISIFGTLKAGGVFVVVNPSTKYSKLTYLLNDCQARVLVSGEAHGQALAMLAGQVSSQPQVILCGGSWEQPLGKNGFLYERIRSEFPPLRPPCESIDLDLACLVYTSGSTGESKRGDVGPQQC